MAPAFNIKDFRKPSPFINCPHCDAKLDEPHALSDKHGNTWHLSKDTSSYNPKLLNYTWNHDTVTGTPPHLPLCACGMAIAAGGYNGHLKAVSLDELNPVDCPSCNADLRRDKAVYSPSPWQTRSDGSPYRYYYSARIERAHSHMVYYHRNRYAYTDGNYCCAKCDTTLKPRPF